ncbi:MAG: sensor histidine kinase [Janthinobacterium lividum]
MSDVVVMLLVAGGGLSNVMDAADPGLHTGVWRETALTSAVVIALWWRRRAPLPVFVLSSVLVAFGATSLALWVVLFNVAVRAGGRSLFAVTAVAAVAFASTSGRPDPADGTLGWLALGAVSIAFVAIPVLAGAYLGTRRELVRNLRERVERVEAEQSLRIQQSQLAERTRIAREMHDVVAHRISLVALHAGGLEVNPGVGADEVERCAALIRTSAHQALQELRGVLGVLRTDTPASSELTPQPSLADVESLVRASAAAGVTVQLHEDLLADATAPLLIGRTAYRVVQEALTNVHKHAGGAMTTVRLPGGPGAGLHVQVRNASPAAPAGIEPPRPSMPGAGLGLVGLRERVELAGGTLNAERAAGGDFIVHAELPWPRGADETT